MAKAIKVAMPPDQALVGDYIVRLTALDPTTGALVAGVKVSHVNLKVIDLTGGAGGSLAVGPFMLVPGPGA